MKGTPKRSAGIFACHYLPGSRNAHTRTTGFLLPVSEQKPKRVLRLIAYQATRARCSLTRNITNSRKSTSYERAVQAHAQTESDLRLTSVPSKTHENGWRRGTKTETTESKVDTNYQQTRGSAASKNSAGKMKQGGKVELVLY